MTIDGFEPCGDAPPHAVSLKARIRKETGNERTGFPHFNPRRISVRIRLQIRCELGCNSIANSGTIGAWNTSRASQTPL